MQPNAWWTEIEQRADRAPAQPRVALLMAGHDVPIGSIEPALGERMAAAGLPIVRAGEGAWQVAAPADPSLARLARWLNDEGLGSRWRDELLEVCDTAGRPLAAIERSVVRPLGIATAAVHLVGRCADGSVWVQQRALDKATDPGLWDTLMGGLMAHGESVRTTLVRETWEEAGLLLHELAEIEPIGEVVVRRPVSDGYMVERIHVYEALLPDGLVPHNQDGEVERFERLSLETLRARLEADRFTLEASLVLLRWLRHRGLR
ncbi:MAG: NUDIX domain-containing protein [Proteobacteria bacterium]|nr:NUDIX domain-containing protein [Pseudomonadota bacterium]